MKTNVVEVEQCVSCHKSMGFPKDCHITDVRRGGRYIEGVGQVCEECYGGLSNDRPRSQDEGE